jgi:hypothetical protein
MEAALMRLPRYARGLKLVRLGVFVMLAQLVVSVVVTVKALGVSSPDEAFDAIKWVQYFLLANLAAAVAMTVGSVMAVLDFRLARMPIGQVVVATAGFAVAAIALWWSHHAISTARPTT